MICERHCGFICADCLSTLAYYSLADGAEHAEECSKLHYIAEIIASGILFLITLILLLIRFKIASFILFNVKSSVKIGIYKGLYFLFSIKFTTFEE